MDTVGSHSRAIFRGRGIIHPTRTSRNLRSQAVNILHVATCNWPMWFADINAPEGLDEIPALFTFPGYHVPSSLHLHYRSSVLGGSTNLGLLWNVVKLIQTCGCIVVCWVACQ